MEMSIETHAELRRLKSQNSHSEKTENQMIPAETPSFPYRDGFGSVTNGMTGWPGTAISQHPDSELF